jgi:hypothetical protein
MSSINNRYTLLPLPGQLEERPTTRPRAEARSTVRPMKPDDFEARQDKFLKNLRSDPIILDRSSGEYAPILNFTSAPLSRKPVMQVHGHDDDLVGKLVRTHDPARDPDIERAVDSACNTAILDRLVKQTSNGQIPKLSNVVSPEALTYLKGEVVKAIRSEPHRPDPEVGARHEKPSALDVAKAAVDKTMNEIGRAVDRAKNAPPITGLASERVKPLVEQVKAFSAQRLEARLHSSAGANSEFERQVTREMMAQIGKLDNTELLKLYKTALSADMREFRLALANRQDDPNARMLLEDLNSYEAMVHMEVIERSQQPAREVDDFQVIDHGPKLGQLGALANTEKRAAHREMAFQSDSYLRGEDANRTEHPGAAAKLGTTGLTAQQVGDALRSADLTINVGLQLFAKGGPFRDPSGGLVTDAPRLKNIYELPQRKGPDYLQRRQMVEHALEPATKHADQSGIDPSNHPISAAVNVGRHIAGAASGYGEVALVLKDSVKDRCTFTAGDSFLAFEARVTHDKISLYKARVHEMLEPGGGLSEPDRQRLREHPTALTTMFDELDRMVGQDFGPGRPFEQAFMQGPLREVDPGQASLLNYRLANVAMDTFMERPAAGGGHVTTPERMSHMIADFNDNVVNAIATGVQDEQRINLPVNDYIEAQVYGGINLANDVAEIRFFEKDTSTMTAQQKKQYNDSVQGLRQMAKELDVRVVQYKPDEAQLTHLNI